MVKKLSKRIIERIIKNGSISKVFNNDKTWKTNYFHDVENKMIIGYNSSRNEKQVDIQKNYFDEQGFFLYTK